MRQRIVILAITATISATHCVEVQPKPGATDSAKPQSGPMPNSVVRPLSALPYTPGLDLQSMDRTADPCVNFYQYACGGWMKNNPIPGDQASWSVYGKMEDENQQFLWGILEDASKQGPARDAVQQRIGDFYLACMDQQAIEKAGAAPLQPTLEKIAALKSTAEISTFLAEQHSETFTYPSGTMFFFRADQDFGDATRVIANIYAGGLGLPDRDYYFKSDSDSVQLRQKYFAHLKRAFELVGDGAQKAEADAKTVMAIETELAQASLTRVEKRDPYNLFHKMTRQQLQALSPSLDWNKYLDRLGLSGVLELNVTEPKFIMKIETALKAHRLEEWQAYLRWHAINARAPYLSVPFVNAHFDFYSRTLQGVVDQPPRWKKCVQWVDGYLGEALGQEFVRRTFSSETKQRALKMTERIEQAMEKEILELPWMSADTKNQARSKLHSIRNKIGFPDTWRDYNSIEIQRHDFFSNIQRATLFESRRQLDKIGKPLDRGEWGMTPPTVNAYYNPQMNDMNFPAGVLQPPLYDPRMDEAPNYGNTGATIGHELTHGFDDEGRKFDDRGNLKDWWSRKDAQDFNARVQCIKDQYKQYVVVDDIHINSDLTAGEDVADLGGQLLAYLAWKQATQDQKLEPLDGLTPEQRFFVGMGQWACENKRPQMLRLHAATDPHSPANYRINGVIANMPEFMQAFGCKPGQPMVNKNPCRVW